MTEYRTKMILYGNGFKEIIEDHIRAGWAVFSIWEHSPENKPGKVYAGGTMGIIITFVRTISRPYLSWLKPW